MFKFEQDLALILSQRYHCPALTNPHKCHTYLINYFFRYVTKNSETGRQTEARHSNHSYLRYSEFDWFKPNLNFETFCTISLFVIILNCFKVYYDSWIAYVFYYNRHFTNFYWWWCFDDDDDDDNDAESENIPHLLLRLLQLPRPLPDLSSGSRRTT